MAMTNIEDKLLRSEWYGSPEFTQQLLKHCYQAKLAAIRSDSMHDDSWSCLFRCTAKRSMPQAESPEDNLYTFVNVDSDGTLTQIVEDDEFCDVGDIVRLTLEPTGDKF